MPREAEVIRALPDLSLPMELPPGAVQVRELSKVLRERIRSALSRPTGWGRDEVARIEAQLVLRHVVEGAPLQPALAILEAIGDVVHTVERIADFSDAGAWMQAVQAAHDYNTLNPSVFAGMDLGMTHRRQMHVGEQAKHLKAQGFSFELVNGEVQMSDAELRRVADELRARVRMLGAIDLARALFVEIAKEYDSKQQRYHLVRRVSSVPDGRPDLPVGFLLNLCVREANWPGQLTRLGSDWRRTLDELRLLATAFTATYDVQPYHTFEGLFRSAHSIPRALQGIAVYDSAFSFVQLRPSDVLSLLRGLFSWVEPTDVLRRCGFTLDTVLRVIEAVLDLTNGKRGPQVIKKTRIRWAIGTKVPPAELKAVFEALTHAPGAANADYLLPTDVSKMDFGFRPLLAWGSDAVLLMDASWCAPAFYEAIASALRAGKLPLVEERIGEAAELFVRDVLRAHGLSVQHGDYDVDGEHGECDAVTETPKRIVFLELKRKALTRLAQGGNDVKLLVDLSKSMVRTQTQLGGHEIRLRRKGRLDLFSKDKAKSTLELEQRDIERVGLTLSDFGSLQDRILLFQIMDALIAADYVPKDSALQNEFDELERCQKQLRDQTQELGTLVPERARRARHLNCWFLSVPQLLILLDGVAGPADFEREIMQTRHVSMGSNNFYFEIAQARRLRGS